jgi:hypothetical protein
MIIVAVPLEPNEGFKHLDFIGELKGLEGGSVHAVLGAFSALTNENESVYNLLKTEWLVEGLGLNSFFADVGGETFTLYSIAVTGGSEGEAALETLSQIKAITEEHFSQSYFFSVSTGVSDAAAVVYNDFWLITLVSALIVLVAAAILLKSPKKAVFLTLLVLFSTFANFAISAIFGGVNFLILWLMAAAQASATVVYAFFVFEKHDQFKKEEHFDDLAAKKTIKSCAGAIFAASLTMAAVCLAVFLISSNLIVKDMAMLLGRGALLGGLTSAVALPCLLYYNDDIEIRENG